jgi:hypothetical protein
VDLADELVVAVLVVFSHVVTLIHAEVRRIVERGDVVWVCPVRPSAAS